MTYRVHLDNFEGPLDLLLYFIRRDEIDIYDIPIANITKEFLDTLETMKQMNIALAGEFIYMAATLMRIKSKMLIPRPYVDEDEKIEDPRKELVHQLLEYSRFKSAAATLNEYSMISSKAFALGYKSDVTDIPEAIDVTLKDVTLYDIATSFKNAMDAMPVITSYELQREDLNLDDQKRFVLKSFDGDGRLLFSSLLNQLSAKIAVVITFLAVLELIRAHQITVVQNELFGELEMQLLSAEA